MWLLKVWLFNFKCTKNRQHLIRTWRHKDKEDFGNSQKRQNKQTFRLKPEAIHSLNSERSKRIQPFLHAKQTDGNSERKTDSWPQTHAQNSDSFPRKQIVTSSHTNAACNSLSKQIQILLKSSTGLKDGCVRKRNIKDLTPMPRHMNFTATAPEPPLRSLTWWDASAGTPWAPWRPSLAARSACSEARSGWKRACFRARSAWGHPVVREPGSPEWRRRDLEAEDRQWTGRKRRWRIGPWGLRDRAKMNQFLVKQKKIYLF